MPLNKETHQTIVEGCPRGVMVKQRNRSEFELQSRHYVYFRTNILVKGMSPLIPQLWVK